MPALLFLLDVKDGDHVSLFQQEVAGPSVEDGLTGGTIHLLGHLILQVLDDNLREGRLEGRGRRKGDRRQGGTERTIPLAILTGKQKEHIHE